MKIAILAAGKSDYFPLFIDKPKCLYHMDGKIQLQKAIEKAHHFVEYKDIIVVAGYKYKYIEHFLESYKDIVLKVNKNYSDAAIKSYRTAIEGETDDIVFVCADENINLNNFEKVCRSKSKIALLYHDQFYYYSTGIFKLRADQFQLLMDDRYLSFEYIKDIYCFANNKKTYDGSFSISSGICLGYTLIDFVRRIGNIQKIEKPKKHSIGDNVDFIYINAQREYHKDLDYFSDTDEYKKSFILRLYSKCFSNQIKRFCRAVKRYVK